MMADAAIPGTAPQDESERFRRRIRELERDLAATRQREAELRQVVDLVPDFIYAVDSDGRILLANKALARAFGKNVDQLCGMLVTDADPNPSQGRKTLEHCQRAINRNATCFVPERFIEDAHGKQRIMQSTSIPYVAADTGKPAILGISVDITDRTGLQRELLRSRHAVIFSLARLAESRDDETGQHLQRISMYTKILSSRLGETDPEIDEDWVHTVSITAALHDIGKVGIPDAVLLKPGPLTEDERLVMQKHTYIGGDTLLEIKQRWQDDLFVVTAAQIALSHHEKWDGSGYPYGTEGDNIPLPARLVALADVYDALTSKRVYKNAMSHEEARDVITEGSGSHFDPAVVEAFLAVETTFREASVRF